MAHELDPDEDVGLYDEDDGADLYEDDDLSDLEDTDDEEDWEEEWEAGPGDVDLYFQRNLHTFRVRLGSESTSVPALTGCVCFALRCPSVLGNLSWSFALWCIHAYLHTCTEFDPWCELCLLLPHVSIMHACIVWTAMAGLEGFLVGATQHATSMP